MLAVFECALAYMSLYIVYEREGVEIVHEREGVEIVHERERGRARGKEQMWTEKGIFLCKPFGYRR